MQQAYKEVRDLIRSLVGSRCLQSPEKSLFRNVMAPLPIETSSFHRASAATLFCNRSEEGVDCRFRGECLVCFPEQHVRRGCKTYLCCCKVWVGDNDYFNLPHFFLPSYCIEA
jgi:hypothetical protein